MSTRVYPVGYTSHDSARYIAQLMRDDNTLMIDCRLSPRSKYPEWQQETLVKLWGDRYKPAGEFLGNVALRRNQARKAQYIGQKPYRNEIEIANPVRGVNGLQYYIKRGYNLILLCQCWDYNNCHLSEVVRLLVERLPEVEVIMQSEVSHV